MSVRESRIRPALSLFCAEIANLLRETTDEDPGGLPANADTAADLFKTAVMRDSLINHVEASSARQS